MLASEGPVPVRLERFVIMIVVMREVMVMTVIMVMSVSVGMVVIVSMGRVALG
jgi:hypothetical protein